MAAEFGVSRATVKRAARDHVEQLRREERRPEELGPLREVDVEALLSLALTANGEALRTGLRILRRGRDDQITVAAGNMVGRALSALVVALIRTGYLPEPGDEYLRRRAERMDEVWGVALARMAERGGLSDEEFEGVLARVSDDARFQGGLALSITTPTEGATMRPLTSWGCGGGLGRAEPVTCRSAPRTAAAGPPDAGLGGARADGAEGPGRAPRPPDREPARGRDPLRGGEAARRLPGPRRAGLRPGPVNGRPMTPEALHALGAPARRRVRTCAEARALPPARPGRRRSWRSCSGSCGAAPWWPRAAGMRRPPAPSTATRRPRELREGPAGGSEQRRTKEAA